MPIKNPEKKRQYDKEYSKKYTRKKRKYFPSTNKILEKKFICFDGETENNNYTLLGNSENYIYNKEGLSSWQCLNFLWKEGKGKIKIIFAIHFDVQFWCKDFTDENIINLLDGIEIQYYCFRLHYFKKKFLKISCGKGTIYIYDIISFFQTSFLKTVEKMQLNLTTKEKNILEKGKSLRGKNFKTMTQNQIIEYNKTECIIAEKIAEKLRYILVNTELKYHNKTFNLYPARFYGAGAIASKVLKNLEMETISDVTRELINTKEYEYIQNSYYGGRFEVFKVGSFKNIFRYDINSAYPYAMTLLKIPLRYKIKKVKTGILTEYNFIDSNIYEIVFNFEMGENNLLGVLPFRRKDGYVLFPKSGHGFYFGIEAKYLNDLCKETIGYFEIKSVLDVTLSGVSLFPENFIEGIYNKRLELKKKNDISEIAYKLGINSLYGKFAQQTGKRQFTNLYSASYITAFCRSMILESVFKNNAVNNIIQIATDGIFTTKKLNTIQTGNELGEWSFDKFDSAIILGSGLYKLENKTEVKHALRGIEVTPENFEKIITLLGKNNKAEVFYNAFIGHKFALANHIKYGKFRLQFAQIKKSIELYSYQKRDFKKPKGLLGITESKWLNIFPNGCIEKSSRLKKFDEIFELEEEAISLETK